MAAVTVGGMDKHSLSKLQNEVRQIVWPVCSAAFGKRGFSDGGRGRFTKRQSNDILLGIDIDVQSGQASVAVQAYLAIYHDSAMRFVIDGLKSTQVGFEVGQESMPMDLQSLSHLLSRFGPVRSRHNVPMLDSSAAAQVADAIVKGVDLVADGYFSHAQSVDDLIAYFESDDQVGGTANRINLLSLLYVTGKMAKLRDLLSQISASNSAPMTVKFKGYIERLLERRDLPSKN